MIVRDFDAINMMMMMMMMSYAVEIKTLADFILYGFKACRMSSAVKNLLEFMLIEILFKISVALSKDSYKDVCRYFGIIP